MLRDLVEATHPEQLAERRESAKAARVEAGEGDSFFQTDTEVNALRERASRELHEAIFTELGPHLPANHVLRQVGHVEALPQVSLLKAVMLIG